MTEERSLTTARACQTIALVTPNYNTAAFIRETLDSVLDQRYPALEYVIVDGASTDGSQAIINDYRDRVHAVISEKDSGHADAINKGFARTSGAIMGWINSDDLLLPDSLVTIDAIFAAFPHVDWITGIPSTATGGVNGATTRIHARAGRNFTYGDFLAGDYRWLQQESTFWRRSLWERAGGRLNTELHLAVDFDLWMRFFRFAELKTVEAPLGAFRLREGQRSVVLRNVYMKEVRAIIQASKNEQSKSGAFKNDEALRRSGHANRLGRIGRRMNWPKRTPDISRDSFRAFLI